MATFRYVVCDVFTAEPLAGNQVAVFTDAREIPEEQLQLLAKELNLSETTFVYPPQADGHVSMRIFTPSVELPFAGHPSLGTAVAVARERGESERCYVQQTPAGLQPVDVRRDRDRARAWMLQELAQMGPQVDAAEALAAVGLAPSDAAGVRLRPQVVSTGVPHLIVPVQRGALARARPDRAALDALLGPLGAVCLYVVAWESGGQAWARSFFVDLAGATEDPATGSAAGPLLAYLHERTGLRTLDVHQGVEMGRRSLLRCRFDEETERLRVGGDVVILAQGTVSLPATGRMSSPR